MGKINASHKIMFEKPGKKIEIKEILHKSPSKRSLDRIHSLLRRADARGSAYIIYRI